MKYAVNLTENALEDLRDIYSYIMSNESKERAEYVLNKIEKTFSTLSDNPNRGTNPDELSNIGIREYRQLFFKPYRIIYQIKSSNVYIHLISDGRRDMNALLQRRLL